MVNSCSFEWRWDEKGNVIPDFSLNNHAMRGLQYCSPVRTSAADLPVSMHLGRSWIMALKLLLHLLMRIFSTTTASKTVFCRLSLSEEQVEDLFQRTTAAEGYKLTVDLVNKKIY